MYLILIFIILIVSLIVGYFIFKNTNNILVLSHKSTSRKVIEPNKLSMNNFNTNLQFIKNYLTDGWSINFWIYIKEVNEQLSSKKYIIKWNNLNIYLEPFSNIMTFEIPVVLSINKKIKIDNFPIQRWVNIHLNVANRYVDIWMNNKLIKTTELNNLANFTKDSTIILTPQPTFIGYIKNLRYYDYGLRQNTILSDNDTINSLYSYGYI